MTRWCMVSLVVAHYGELRSGPSLDRCDGLFRSTGRDPGCEHPADVGGELFDVALRTVLATDRPVQPEGREAVDRAPTEECCTQGIGRRGPTPGETLGHRAQQTSERPFGAGLLRRCSKHRTEHLGLLDREAHVRSAQRLKLGTGIAVCASLCPGQRPVQVVG